MINICLLVCDEVFIELIWDLMFLYLFDDVMWVDFDDILLLVDKFFGFVGYFNGVKELFVVLNIYK